MSEPMQAEVVCGWEPCGHCAYPEIAATATTHPVVEGSVTEARLKLADAAEAWLASGFWSATTSFTDAIVQSQEARLKMEQAGVALAALRTEVGA